MKQIYSFSRTILLLFLLIFGIGSAWADIVIDLDLTVYSTYPSNYPKSSSKSSTPQDVTWGGYNFTINSTSDTKPYYSSSNGAVTGGYLLFGKCKANQAISIDFPAIENYKLTKVEMGTTSGGSTNVYVTVRDGSSEVSGGDSKQYTTSSTLTWDLTGTSANTSYCLYFLGNNTSGRNVQVASLKLTYASAGSTKLSAPSNLKSSNVTTAGATLSWDAVEHASSYTVMIGDTEHSGVNTNSYNATGLTSNTAYNWTVKAVGDGTNYTTSDYASTASFKTAPALLSIAVSGTPTKLTYEVGETLDPSGLVVTANYEGGSSEVVTEDINWTFDPNTFALDNTSCSVIATWSGKNSTAYTVSDIVVNAPSVKYNISLTQPTEATIESSLTSAAEGVEVTLSYSDVAEHYHFVSWSVVDASSNPITVTNNKFRMPASNVTVSATFAEDAKFAVTYHVNGNTSAKASVNLYEGDAIDLTAPTTGIPMDYEFKGWIEASSYYSETDAPTFVTSATMGTSAKHYYAVFAKQKSAGGTVDYQLTSSAISENLTASTRAYADAETSYDDGTVKWGFVGYVQTAKCKFLQIRNTSPASYISFEAPAAITNVALGVTNGSDNNFTGDIYIKTSADATSSSNDENIVGSGTSTNKQSSIAVSGTHTELYMQVSAAARITSITLTCKSAPVYSDYCTDVKDIHHIKVTTAPTKVLYKVGESLDIAGMVVTAYYDAEETDSRVLSSGYTVTPNAALTTSDANITVTLNADNTKTATTPIDVVALDKIVATGAKNTYYVSQDFDPAGLVVTATWGTEEGKKIEEEVTASATISDDKNLQNGTTSVRISYTHEGTTKTFDYAITVSQSSEKALTRLTMSNGFKPFITSTNLVAYYIQGTEVPTINESSIAVSPYATKRVEDNNIIVTAQDGTEATYTVTTTEVAPLMTSTTETVTFDGSDDEKTWIKTGYTFDSDKGWRIAKNLDDSKESRIVNGKNRIYFYIGPATSFKLINGGIDTNRDIKVFVNNTETDITSIGKKSGSDNFILLTSQLADNFNNVICIESANTGGDAGFTQYELTINPKHHIVYNVNGEATDEYVYGGYALTFPSVADQGGKVFLGWKKDSGIDGVVEDFSDFADTKVNATESVEYYAVFATKSGSLSNTFDRITDPSTLKAGDVIAITGNGSGITSKVLNTSFDDSSLSAAESNGTIIVTNDAQKWTLVAVDGGWNLTNNGETLGVETLPTSSTTNADASLCSSNNVWSIDIHTTNQSTVMLHNDNVYIDYFGQKWQAYYNTRGNGSSSVALRLYKAQSNISYSAYATSFATSGELSLVAQNNENGTVYYYATFSSEYDVEFGDEVEVNTVTVSEDQMTLIPVSSNQVPANTGVLIKATATEVSYKYIAEATALPDNMLKPGTGGMTEGDKCRFYRLAYYDYDAKTGLGFYYGSGCDDGQAFMCKAGTAYLAVPNNTTGNAPARFLLGRQDVPTDLLNVNDNNQSTKVMIDGRLYILRDGKTYDSFGRMVK